MLFIEAFFAERHVVILTGCRKICDSTREDADITKNFTPSQRFKRLLEPSVRTKASFLFVLTAAKLGEQGTESSDE